jgi:hypothetical protein
MRPRLLLIVAAGTLLAPPILAAGGNTFCCNDDGGRQVCSDILPPQCYGRAYREINDRGITIRRIEAPLTAEQRAQRELELRKKREEERLAQEQRRKDLALLQTYGTAQDIDIFRARTIKDLERSIADTRERQEELRAKQKTLLEEAEFYKKKPMPADLRNAIKNSEAEIQTLQNLIDLRNRDIDAAKVKYDEDKRRYLELTRDKSGAPRAQVVSPGDTPPR